METINEPSWRRQPIHFTTEPNGEGGTRCIYPDYTFEEYCAGCEDLVGAIQMSEKETSGMSMNVFVNYWQIDEDGEHLLCEDCYENEPTSLDDCVKCNAPAWINTKGRCSTCEGETK